MKILLHTETVIDSAHKLEGYDGKCSQLHGHSWFLEVWFKGDSDLKDKVGILVDFGIVSKLKEVLDHKYLNDVMSQNPTAENLSEFIYDFLKLNIKKGIQIKVKLFETKVGKETWCEVGDF